MAHVPRETRSRPTARNALQRVADHILHPNDEHVADLAVLLNEVVRGLFGMAAIELVDAVVVHREEPLDAIRVRVAQDQQLPTRIELAVANLQNAVVGVVVVSIQAREGSRVALARLILEPRSKLVAVQGFPVGLNLKVGDIQPHVANLVGRNGRAEPVPGARAVKVIVKRMAFVASGEIRIRATSTPNNTLTTLLNLMPTPKTGNR